MQIDSNKIDFEQVQANAHHQFYIFLMAFSGAQDALNAKIDNNNNNGDGGNCALQFKNASINA